MSVADSMPISRQKRLGRILASGGLVLWAVATVTAFEYFWRLDAVPGRAAASPGSLDHSGASATVLVFLDPNCPCSRATMAELSRAAAQIRIPVAYRVYFVVPDAADRSWTESSLYTQAALLPGVAIESDTGAMKDRHGVRTSGQILAYRADGSLAFQGGVTGSRGHEGDNSGRTRLVAALNNGGPTMVAPVYGCSLPPASGPREREKTP